MHGSWLRKKIRRQSDNTNKPLQRLKPLLLIPVISDPWVTTAGSFTTIPPAMEGWCLLNVGPFQNKASLRKQKNIFDEEECRIENGERL